MESCGIAVDLFFFPDEYSDRGYFVDDSVLAINIWWKDWKETFLHEYCHFLQYRGNAEVAQKFQEDPCPANTAELEKDCELRVVGLLSMLDMDYNSYAEKANFEHLVEYFGEEYAI